MYDELNYKLGKSRRGLAEVIAEDLRSKKLAKMRNIIRKERKKRLTHNAEHVKTRQIETGVMHMTPTQIRLEIMTIKIEINSGYLSDPNAEYVRFTRLQKRLKELRALERQIKE